MKHNPPEEIHPILFRIEAATVDTRRKYDRLSDDDVEFVYQKLYDYYSKSAKGSDPKEPSSTVRRKDELITRIFNILESRYEEGLDEHLVNSQRFQPSGFPFRNEDAVYALALKHLIRSVRLWRKKDGKKGYLRFVSEHIPEGSGDESPYEEGE